MPKPTPQQIQEMNGLIQEFNDLQKEYIDKQPRPRDLPPRLKQIRDQISRKVDESILPLANGESLDPLINNVLVCRGKVMENYNALDNNTSRSSVTPADIPLIQEQPLQQISIIDDSPQPLQTVVHERARNNLRGYETIIVNERLQTETNPITREYEEKIEDDLLNNMQAALDIALDEDKNHEQKKQELQKLQNENESLGAGYLSLAGKNNYQNERLNFLLIRANNFMINALELVDPNVTVKNHINLQAQLDNTEAILNSSNPDYKNISEFEFYVQTFQFIDKLSKFQHKREKLLTEKDDLTAQIQANRDQRTKNLKELEELQKANPQDVEKINILKQANLGIQDRIRDINAKLEKNTKEQGDLVTKIKTEEDTYLNFAREHKLSGAMTAEQYKMANTALNQSSAIRTSQDLEAIKAVRADLKALSDEISQAIAAGPNSIKFNTIGQIRILPLYPFVSGIAAAIGLVHSLEAGFYNRLKDAAQVIDKIVDGIADTKMFFTVAGGELAKIAVAPVLLSIEALNRIVQGLTYAVSFLNTCVKGITAMMSFFGRVSQALGFDKLASVFETISGGLAKWTKGVDDRINSVWDFTKKVENLQGKFEKWLDGKVDAKCKAILEESNALKDLLTKGFKDYCDQKVALAQHDKAAIQDWAQEKKAEMTFEGNFTFRKNGMTGQYEFYVPENFIKDSAKAQEIKEKCHSILTEACKDSDVILIMKKDSEGNPCYQFSGPDKAVKAVVEQVNKEFKEYGNELIAERKAARQKIIERRAEKRIELGGESNNSRVEYGNENGNSVLYNSRITMGSK